MEFIMTLKRRGDLFLGQFFLANVAVWRRDDGDWTADVAFLGGGGERFRERTLRDALHAARLSLEACARREEERESLGATRWRWDGIEGK